MKRVVIGVFLFLVAASFVGVVRGEQVGTTDLVGRWSFDEASWSGAGAVKDSAPSPPGSSSHGTAFGGTKPEAGGKKSSAVIFDGVDDYIRIPSNTALTPSSGISVSGWFKINEIPDPKTGRLITGSMVSKRDGYILSPDTDRSISFYVNVGGTWQAVVTPAATLQIGAWHHIVGTYDGTMIRVYIDGVERKSAAAVGSITHNAEPICIGHDYCGGDTSVQGRFFGGAMDEIGIYRRALTASEVQELRQTSTANAPGAACSVGDQAILRLYDESNSHVAAGDKNAPYSICFKRLFPSEPLPTGNAYACTGTNVLLRATGSENAHAENPSLNTANYREMCYGELTCSLTPANGACSAGQQFVIALSEETNAHVSATPAPGYAYSLCCSVKGPTINTVEWQSTSGQKLAGVGSQYDATRSYPFIVDGKAKIVVKTKNIKLSDLQNFKIEVRDVDKDMDAIDDQTDDVAGTQLTPRAGSARYEGTCPNVDGRGCIGTVEFDWTFSNTDATMKKMYGSAKEDEKQLVGERFELVANVQPNTAGLSARDSDILYAQSGKGWMCDNIDKTMAKNLENGKRVWTEKSRYTTATDQKIAGDACMGSDGKKGGGSGIDSTSRDDCCPVGMQCTDTGCVLTGIASCQDYTRGGKTICEADPANVWRNKPPYVSETQCGDTKYEKACVWNTAQNRCEYSLKQISTAAGANNGKEIAQCSYFYDATNTECVDNYQTVTVYATPDKIDSLSCSGPKDECNKCKDGCIQRIPCGQPAVELPFFGTAQFAAAVVSIALLYAIMFQFQRVRRFFVRGR